MARYKIYTYKGFSGSLPEVCKHFNIGYDAIRQRILKGMSLEEAIKTPINEKRKIYTYKGFSGSLPNVCKYFNINYKGVSKRMRSGESLRKSIEASIQVKNKIYTYKEFSGALYEICKHVGICYISAYDRIKRGMSLEEAIEVPLSKNPSLAKIYNYKEQNGTIRELCELNDKDFISVYNLMKSNHTIEWAIEHGEDEV